MGVAGPLHHTTEHGPQILAARINLLEVAAQITQPFGRGIAEALKPARYRFDRIDERPNRIAVRIEDERPEGHGAQAGRAVRVEPAIQAHSQPASEPRHIPTDSGVLETVQLRIRV